MSRVLLSILPDSHWADELEEMVESRAWGWRHVPIRGEAARSFLKAGEDIRAVLGGSRLAFEGQEREELARLRSFLGQALADDELADRYLVLSPSLVPIDLAVASDGTHLGYSSVVSHQLTGTSLPDEETLRRLLEPCRVPRASYLLVCPMAMDRALPRHMQDIVTVAASLESAMPVELWLQPSLSRALKALEREDVSWLHIDTHGDNDGQKLMLGPTRGASQLVEASDLPERIAVPLVVAVGCALTGGPASIGTELLRRGVTSVFGPCTVFESLSIAGSDKGQAAWYRAFFEAMLEGSDVGVAVREARRATPGSLYKYAWILLGASQLTFDD